MPASSRRAPVRSMDVRWVVAWRAKASWAICRTRTCSRESFVGRRKSYVRGSLRRARDPRACDKGPPATAPVSGRVTSTLIGGRGAHPDRPCQVLPRARERCDDWDSHMREVPVPGSRNWHFAGGVAAPGLLGHVLVVVDAHHDLGAVLLVGVDDLLLER